FNAAFVPNYAGLLAREGLERAQHLAGSILTIAVAVQAALLAVALLFMPLMMRVLAPGFADEPGKLALAIELGRITFPYLLLITLVVLLGGILNSHGHFAAMAAAPILLNACLIVALLLLVPLLPTAGHALAWGVAAAGVAQAGYLALDAR